MTPDVLKLMHSGDEMDAVALKRLEAIRTRQWRRLAEVIRRFDALVRPTMALPAPAVGLADSNFDQEDGTGRYHGLDMTSPFNKVPQCPALNIPSGMPRDGLPTGLQIVGRRFGDRRVQEIGAALAPVLDRPDWQQ